MRLRAEEGERAQRQQGEARRRRRRRRRSADTGVRSALVPAIRACGAGARAQPARARLE